MYDTVTITREEGKMIAELLRDKRRGNGLIDNLVESIERQVYANCYPSPQGEAPAGQLQIPGLES